METFAVGDKVRQPHAFRDYPSYRRIGKVVRVARGFVHVAWSPQAVYPKGTFMYRDGSPELERA